MVEKKSWSARHNDARVMMMLNSSLPVTGAGYAVRSHSIATHLLGHGVDLEVFTRPGFPQNTTNMPKEVSMADQVEDVVYQRIPLHPVGMGKFGPDYRDKAANLVASIARKRKHSIIHAASDIENGLPALLGASRAGIPGIYEYRGMWHYSSAATNTWFPWTEPFQQRHKLELECGHRASAVFAISKALKRDLVKSGLPEEKITVLPNAVDVKKFKPLPPDKEILETYGLKGRRVIGFIGSFTAYEGLENLMDAVLALNWEGLPVTLLLVGNGPGAYQERLHKLHKARGSHPAIIFTGRVDFAEVPRYYSVMDIMPFCRIPAKVCQCVPPLKPLEALAMRKAVLVSDVDALTEMIWDGDTGLVCAAGDQRALTTALRRLVMDDELCSRLAARGRDWVLAQRDWSKVSEIILRVYEKVLEIK